MPHRIAMKIPLLISVIASVPAQAATTCHIQEDGQAPREVSVADQKPLDVPLNDNLRVIRVTEPARGDIRISVLSVADGSLLWENEGRDAAVLMSFEPAPAFALACAATPGRRVASMTIAGLWAAPCVADADGTYVASAFRFTADNLMQAGTLRYDNANCQGNPVVTWDGDRMAYAIPGPTADVPGAFLLELRDPTADLTYRTIYAWRDGQLLIAPPNLDAAPNSLDGAQAYRRVTITP